MLLLVNLLYVIAAMYQEIYGEDLPNLILNNKECFKTRKIYGNEMYKKFQAEMMDMPI